MDSNPQPLSITAVVLAGGRGQRMGGSDKGLLPLGGRPLIAWTLARIAPQAAELVISANRNLERYEGFGYPVIRDRMPDHPGPLAGLHRAMENARHPLILCVPCDTPRLPPDVAKRLYDALLGGNAEIAVAEAGGQPQPVVCLCRRELAADLGRFLSQGGRRMGEWQSRLERVGVPFEDAEAFVNINRPQELSRFDAAGA